jgi:hypothetical protein
MVMLILIVVRSFEIHIGRDVIPKKVRIFLDEKLKSFFRVCFILSIKFKNKVIRELKKIPVAILHLLVNLWVWALRITLKTVNLMQGRKNGKGQGSVSGYLKTVENYREKIDN